MKMFGTYLYVGESPKAFTLDVPCFSGRFPLQNAPILLSSAMVCAVADHFVFVLHCFSVKRIVPTSKRIISTSQRTVSRSQITIFPQSRSVLLHTCALAVRSRVLGLQSHALEVRSHALEIPSGLSALLNGALPNRIRPSPLPARALPLRSRLF